MMMVMMEDDGGGTKCETVKPPKGVLVFVEYLFLFEMAVFGFMSVEIETIQARPWKCWVCKLWGPQYYLAGFWTSCSSLFATKLG